MYRKKRKKKSDVDKEEIVSETITRVMHILRVACVNIPADLSLPQAGYQSSCEEELQQVSNEEPLVDTIDLLSEPTKCSLLDGSGNNMELALAIVYPKQETYHTVPVQDGCAVVQPTSVWSNAKHINLPIPVGDEIINMGESLLQWIQLPIRCYRFRCSYFFAKAA
ncbi:unnamed protein product [Urochloa humidicola]